MQCAKAAELAKKRKHVSFDQDESLVQRPDKYMHVDVRECNKSQPVMTIAKKLTLDPEPRAKRRLTEMEREK